MVAASASNVPLGGSRYGELQQLGQRGCPGPMHGHAQQLVYFARDFLLDGFGRFFSWADGAVSPTGRNSQICSLTSNS